MIYILSIEKTLQHLFTALFFIVSTPGISTPDIGTNFQIDNNIMAILNLIYFAFFVFGIIGFLKKKKWAIKLIIVLALLDIILEFVYHHFFFITISVIISTILVIISYLYLKLFVKLKYTKL